MSFLNLLKSFQIIQFEIKTNIDLKFFFISNHTLLFLLCFFFLIYIKYNRTKNTILLKKAFKCHYLVFLLLCFFYVMLWLLLKLSIFGKRCFFSTFSFPETEYEPNKRIFFLFSFFFLSCKVVYFLAIKFSHVTHTLRIHYIYFFRM